VLFLMDNNALKVEYIDLSLRCLPDSSTSKNVFSMNLNKLWTKLVEKEQNKWGWILQVYGFNLN